MRLREAAAPAHTRRCQKEQARTATCALASSPATSRRCSPHPSPSERRAVGAVNTATYVPVGPRAQILAQTADVASFFATMSVNSLSAFKKVFLANELSAPMPGQPYTYPPPRGAASPAAAPASAAAGSAVAGPGGSPAHGQEAAVQSADDTPLASALESDEAVSKAYDELKGGWEALKWRMLPRPGGAVMKPDKFCAPPPHDAPCLRVDDPGAPAGQ